MWVTTGHDNAVGILDRSLHHGRASHAYLVTGPHQVGKRTLALDFAKALNCTEDDGPCQRCGQCSKIDRGIHPDVRMVGLLSGEVGDRVSIGIDQVREIQRESALKPYEGTSRVFIFDDAEKLSDEAANSLLKTLEEPPEQVVLLLLAEDHSSLLPTLVSRCQLIKLKSVPVVAISGLLQERHGVNLELATSLAGISNGNPGRAIDALTNQAVMEEITSAMDAIESLVKSGVEDRFNYVANMVVTMSKDRNYGRRHLTLWLTWWRAVMLVKQGVPKLADHVSDRDCMNVVACSLTSIQIHGSIRAVQRASYHLDRNVSPRLVLERLMLEIPMMVISVT